MTPRNDDSGEHESHDAAIGTASGLYAKRAKLFLFYPMVALLWILIAWLVSVDHSTIKTNSDDIIVLKSQRDTDKTSVETAIGLLREDMHDMKADVKELLREVRK